MAEPLLNIKNRTSIPHLQAIDHRHNVDDPAENVQIFIQSLRPFWGRALLYIVLLFVCIAVVWAWHGKVDVVTSAPFRLVPLGQVKTLQAQRGGEVEMIGVQEGDSIKKGQLLFKFKSWETWSELRELEQTEIAFEKAFYDLKRVLPQRSELNRETIGALENRLNVLQQFMAVHQEALDDYRKDSREIATLESRADDSELQTQIGLRQAEIDHLKQQFNQQKILFQRKHISRADMNRARMQYLSALAALPGQMSKIYQNETDMQNLKRQILERRIAHEREVSQMQHAYETARLRLEQAQKRTDRLIDAESDLIIAPEAGIVTKVMVNTAGHVITKGQKLVTIAPASSPIVAELMILNKDVGLLKPGQAVKLKYDAFAYQDFGLRRGWLEHISPDAVIGENSERVFRSIVVLEENVIRVEGGEKPLMFGMTGTAEIVIDRQSVLLMLLSPLRQLYESAQYDVFHASLVQEGAM